MPTTKLASCFLLLLLLPALAGARELAGLRVPETVEISPGRTLALNGAGVYTEFFVKVFVGALYLPMRESRAESVIASPQANSLRMQVLCTEIDEDDFSGFFRDGFHANLSAAEEQALAPRIAQFIGLFKAVKRGGTVRLDYVPEAGTEVRINDELRGIVPGPDFHQALLRIWLGVRPADSGLKRAVLGG